MWRFNAKVVPLAVGSVGTPASAAAASHYRGSGRHSVSSEAAFARVGEFSVTEFGRLPTNLPGRDALPEPRRKFAPLNRYSDIIPNPHSRVPLGQIAGGPGYINANFIRSFDGSRKAYIATQGPIAATISHFWQMTWEQGSTIIVMLTGLIELGRSKCDRYWPAGVGSEFEAQYGDFFITTTSTEQIGSYTRSVLHLRRGKRSSDVRIINHFWFNTWPDHGTPPDVKGVLHMLADARGGDDSKPWVVHCSAGIGRTGTFIGIDMGARRLSRGDEADVLGLIRAMREDRGGMVQTDAQAAFVHRALVSLARDLDQREL